MGLIAIAVAVVGLGAIVCFMTFAGALVWLLVKYAQGERENNAMLIGTALESVTAAQNSAVRHVTGIAERAYMHLKAQGPLEVVNADMERERTRVGLAAMEKELDDLQTKKTQVAEEQLLATTIGGDQIPWSDLTAVDDTNAMMGDT